MGRSGFFVYIFRARVYFIPVDKYRFFAVIQENSSLPNHAPAGVTVMQIWPPTGEDGFVNRNGFLLLGFVMVLVAGGCAMVRTQPKEPPVVERHEPSTEPEKPSPQCPEPPEPPPPRDTKPCPLPEVDPRLEYKLTRQALKQIRSDLPDMKTHTLFKQAEDRLQQPPEDGNPDTRYRAVLNYRLARALGYEAMARTLKEQNQHIRRRIEQLGKIQEGQHKLDTSGVKRMLEGETMVTQDSLQGSSSRPLPKTITEPPGIPGSHEVLFRPGSTRLSSRDKDLLSRIADLLRDYRLYRVRLVGHSDTVPIGSNRFSSNWELSAQRALSVLEYLIHHEGLDPERFEVKAYGGQKPRVPNNSPRNRARNRRVEIRMIPLAETR